MIASNGFYGFNMVYNRAIMKFGLLLQKKLRFEPGMIATDGVAEVLLVCRKHGGGVSG